MSLGPSSTILQPVNSDASVCRTIAGDGSSWLTGFDGSVAQGAHGRVRIVSPAALPVRLGRRQLTFCRRQSRRPACACRRGSEMRERPLA